MAEHIRDFVLEKSPTLAKEQTVIIPNGINVEKYTFRERNSGFDIAYVGYINYKKGPMLLLHTFKAIHDKDSRYKLHIAGAFQDDRDVMYFRQMIQEWNLEENVIFYGWQENLDQWLEGKNYILCTSLLESQNISVMEGMAKGIKPLIHNFVGARGIYKNEWIWRDAAECISLLNNKDYKSREYRKFVADNYSLDQQVEQCANLFTAFADRIAGLSLRIKNPKVTVGIANYNYSQYLDQCIQSVFEQTYDNIEILIIDDCSTDDSIEKIREYEKKYDNITAIYHEKNSGNMVQAIVDIFREAKGEYSFVMSADDLFAYPSAVEEFVACITSDSELDYVYCNLRAVEENLAFKEVWRYAQYTKEEIARDIFQRWGSGTVPMTVGIFKQSYFENREFSWYDDKKNRVAADTLNVLYNTKYGWKIKHLDRDLIMYRHHGSNITYNLKARIPSLISNMEYIVNNFSEKIYFSEVEWDRLPDQQRNALKYFLIGKHYLAMYEYYVKGQWQPWSGTKLDYDEAKLREWVQPLQEVVVEYFTKSIEFLPKYSEAITNLAGEWMNSAGKSGKRSLSTMQNQDADLTDIHATGRKLREALLAEYRGFFIKDKNKVLILSPESGAWKYSFASWRSVLEHMGKVVDVVTDLRQVKNPEQYNVFIAIASQFYIQQVMQYPAILAIHQRIGIVSKEQFSVAQNLSLAELKKDTDIDRQVLDTLVHASVFSLLISSASPLFIEKTLSSWRQRGLKIISIPFGFNPLQHYPEKCQTKYDYFFVGHNSYLKYSETEKYLLPVLQKHRGMLRGTGWGEQIEDLNYSEVRHYYSAAAINLNYHLSVQKEYACEVNERTFIICACGGFQLVDSPLLLPMYYNSQELAIAKSPQEYLEKFEYYLAHPKERNEFAYRGMVKTYNNKVSLFERMRDLFVQIGQKA